MATYAQDGFGQYLVASQYIDWQNLAVRAKAQELTATSGDVTATACHCFEFVRDKIRHSGDYNVNPVTCKASETLEHATGFCYAKSHLLAALLRANGIPAGLCYQRLTIENNQPPLCLHGLNAVFLPDIGWYRIDARGTKPGVEAGFTPPVEKLAFSIRHKQEADLPEIWPEPLPIVIQVLSQSNTFQEVRENLPDIALVSRKLETLEMKNG
jgi:transglutaminase-like putative cysteine protease